MPAELVGEIVEGAGRALDRPRTSFERLEEYQEPPPAEQIRSALADRGRELAGDLLASARAAGDHEARVVARERADDLRMLEPVERAGDRGSRAELRLDDDDVLRRGRAHAELRAARLRAPRAGRGAARGPGSDVARPAERVARLLEPQLADVARDRRLRDEAARLRKRLGQLELAADAACG